MPQVLNINGPDDGTEQALLKPMEGHPAGASGCYTGGPFSWQPFKKISANWRSGLTETS